MLAERGVDLPCDSEYFVIRVSPCSGSLAGNR